MLAVVGKVGYAAAMMGDLLAGTGEARVCIDRWQMLLQASTTPSLMRLPVRLTQEQEL
jgi:hypothetical protein